MYSSLAIITRKFNFITGRVPGLLWLWKKLFLVLIVIVLVQGIYIAAVLSSRVTLDMNIKSLLYDFRGLSFCRVKKKLLRKYS